MALWILNKKIVNGIPLNECLSDKIANGFGCLIAQYIRDHKPEVGDLYITSIDSDPQDYNYKVIFDTDRWLSGRSTDPNDLITITVNNWGENHSSKGLLRDYWTI